MANGSVKQRFRLPAAVSRARASFGRWLAGQQLDEASFLYDQRRFLLADDQLPWVDVADNERRFLRHLFALELLAKDGSVHVEELIGDTGGLHTAVSLLCRQGRFDRMCNLVAGTDLTEEDAFWAVADALKWECPESWRRRLLQLLDTPEQRSADLLAVVFGYRRWPLDPVLERAADPVSPELIRAIGRSGSALGIDRLGRVLAGADESLKTQAAVSLLRLGRTDHLRGVFPIIDADHWAVLPLGLSGRLDVQDRLERLADVSPNADALVSIGLLGRPSAVGLLVSTLTHETLGRYASCALQMITGADLREEVFIPEEIDPDALTREERDRSNRGEPVYASGEIPGDTVERLCQNPAEWQSWWRANRSRFDPRVPYRLGRPYSPDTLVEMLASPGSTRLMRTLAHEELVIRYRVDFAFETDFLVTEQQHILSQLGQWLGDHRDVARRYVGAGSL